MLALFKFSSLTAFLLAALAVSADNETNMLTGTCIVCHGDSGASAGPAIPNLSSMSPNYLMGAMLAYKYENKDETRLEKTEERKENEIKRAQTKATEDQRAKTHENE